MSDRDKKADEIRERSANRRNNTSDMDDRMSARLQNDTTPASQDTSSSDCQGETRNGDPCENDAIEGSQYCSKHQPNKHGELTWKFERKQWYIHPDLRPEIFDDERNSGSLYDNAQNNVGSLSQKSFQNAAAEFLLENSDEFQQFLDDKYNND